MLLYLVMVSFVFMSENFESGQIPADWQIYNHGIQDATWTVGSGWAIPLQPPNYGTYYAYLDAGQDSLANDTLVSPSVDITQNHSSLLLSYSMSLYGDPSSTDTGRVLIRFYSSSGWGSWNELTVYTRDVYQQVDSFDIYSMANGQDSLQLGFVYAAGDTPTGWFAVDNIEVTGNLIVSNDVEVDSIISPSGYISTNANPVSVLVVNNSSSALSNVPLTVTITDTTTGNTEYNNSTTFNIQAGETLTVSLPDFQATADTQFFNVCAYTSLSGDPSPQNDTAYSFAYSYPILGTILSSWEIPSNDSNWWGVDYKEGKVYVLNARTGEIMSYTTSSGTFNTVYDLPGEDSLIFWDIAGDVETGNWWITALKLGTQADSQSYVLKYDNNWNFLESKHINLQAGDDSAVGVPSSIDDQPFTQDTLFMVSFRAFEPIKFVEADFSNIDSITLVDSNITVVSEIIGAPSVLSRVSDTLFLVQGSGDGRLFLISTNWSGAHTIITEEDIDYIPTGGDVAFNYMENPDDWITAYLTVGGHALYRISLGIKWSKVGVTEFHKRGKHESTAFIIHNGLLPESLYNQTLNKRVNLYSTDGRRLYTGKIVSRKLPFSLKTGVYILTTKENKTFKLIKR